MITRYYGIDIHKQFVMVAAVDARQEIVQAPLRIEINALATWITRQLTPADQVVIEVSTNTWPIYDLLAARVGRVVVANPYKTKLIAEARIKSDKVAALALARLLAANFICEVWVPDAHLRQKRALAAHRMALQKQGTRLKNRLHSLLSRLNLRCPAKDLFSQAGQTWLRDLSLSANDSLQLRHLLAQLEGIAAQRDETERLMARQASQDPRIGRLMQLTGIGYYSAFAILAIIGDIQRFPTPHKLTAYAGLVPGLNQSGQHTYYGHITKAGSPSLRWLLVEAARVAVRWDPHWQQVHARISRRRGTNIAVVAVARKLLVVIWHLLTHQAVYRHLRPNTFVRKLQEWAYRIGKAHLPASSAQRFVQDCLTNLGLEQLAASLVMDPKKGGLSVQPA